MTRLPVTVLAGFLGSGKTTLVNRLLEDPGGRRFAVIVNEFGEVGIDGRLVVATEEDMVQLENGCVCCTVRGDLSAALVKLLDRRGRLLGGGSFDHVLIEGSGLASPGPIVQTLEVDPALGDRLQRARTVTLVHGGRFTEQVEAYPEAVEQVAHADLVLVNHTDHAEGSAVEAAEELARSLNPIARIQRSVRSDVSVPELLELAPLERASGGGTHHAHASGVHAQVLESDLPLDVHRLKMWLQFLANRWGTEIVRIKGVLACQGHAQEVVVQAVYEWLELGPGTAAAPERSQLVLIGKGFDMEEVERGWRACLLP